MQDTKAAIRYAKALIGLSAEKGQLDAVLADMTRIHGAVSSSRDLQVVLQSPVITADRKLTALNTIFGNSLSELTSLFLSLLLKNGREDVLGDISKQYIEQYKALKGITTVKVTSATALTEDLRKRILDILAKEVPGKVELETSVNPELVGGFVLNIGDRQLDTSIRSRFNALRQEFNTKQYVKQF